MHDRHFSPGDGARFGALVYGFGALGLVAVCIFYVLAGPEAALPGGASSNAAAIAATPVAAPWMRMAGLIGMPVDVLLAVGAWLLALREYRRGAICASAGWLGVGVAGLLFVLVDAVVALVLPVAASQSGGEAAYAGLRALFDVLFAIGTWAAGLAALAIAWRTDGALWRWPAAGWAMRAAGVVCLAAGTGHLFAGVGSPLLGPGISLLALASLGAAAAYLRAGAVGEGGALQSRA